MADDTVWREIRVLERGFDFRALFKPPANESEGLFVFQHGIGSSAMTFELLARHLNKILPGTGLLAFDSRYHGLTKSTGNADGPMDLSQQALVDDFEHVVKHILDEERVHSSPLLLIGHSMGGTVVSAVACHSGLENIRGLAVLDAVEGYAAASLAGMHRLLSMWPDHFDSLEQAVAWHVGRGHQLRNRASAEVSVPPLFVYNEAERTWKWRIDLSKTEKDWDTWFAGLDDMFLTAPTARLLALAGAGRLDKALTVGQMQGKYQLVVFQDCDHYLHEDQPEKAAQMLQDFWDRNGKPLVFKPKFGKMRT